MSTEVAIAEQGVVSAAKNLHKGLMERIAKHKPSCDLYDLADEIDQVQQQVLLVRTALNQMDEPRPMLSTMVEAAAKAYVMKVLDESNFMSMVEPLVGNKIGFTVDVMTGGKENTYPAPVIRSCIMEALMRGLRITGNEFCVISGNCYMAQAGAKRLFLEFPGVVDVELTQGAIEMKGVALVSQILKFGYDGERKRIEFLRENEDGLDTRTRVRVNAGMGDDAILGKAKRKAYAAGLEWLTGITYKTADDDFYTDDDPRDANTVDVSMTGAGILQHFSPELGEEFDELAYFDKVAAATSQNELGRIMKEAEDDERFHRMEDLVDTINRRSAEMSKSDPDVK